MLRSNTLISLTSLAFLGINVKAELIPSNHIVDQGLLDILGDYLTPGGENISHACKLSGEIYKDMLMKNASWAIQMLDSDPKFPQAGVMEGNLIHFPGAFDECLKVDSGSFKGKYCQMGIQRKSRGDARLVPFFLVPESLAASVKYATCIPSTCTDKDAKNGLDRFLAESRLPGMEDLVSFTQGCQTEAEHVELSSGDYIMIAFLSITLLTIFIATMTDLYQRFINKHVFADKFLGIVQGFSLYHNTNKLFDTKLSSESIGCINGIRFISMTWVLIGHTLMVFMYEPYITNFTTMLSPEGPISTMAMAVLWNALDSVDTFFLIGAILLSYLTLKQLEKSGGGIKMWVMFYIHRYLRLTGIYLVIILLHIILLKFLAYGPQGFLLLDISSQCRDHWLDNILYINIYTGLDCLGHTWYMAVDMHFYIISPTIIYTLWKHPRYGLIFAGVLMILATGYPLGVAMSQGLDPGWDWGGNDDVYIKPAGRFQPYLFGLLVGYYLHQTRNQPTLLLNYLQTTFLWIVAGLVGSLCIYGIAPYNPVLEKAPSLTEVVVYNGFNRIAWSCAVSWVIVACIKKKGGPVNEFLSWSGFIPLARISYVMYLTHMTVLTWHDSVLKNAMSYSTEIFIFFSLINVMVTAAVSVILVVVFEMPIVHLEKLLFSVLGVGGMPKPKRYLRKKVINENQNI